MYRNSIKILRCIYDELCTVLSSSSLECGVILGASNDGTVKKIYHDKTGKSTESSYTPDIEAVNKVLCEWFEENIVMCGIIHSHTIENPVPSCADINYAINILKALDTVKEFYIPIYYNSSDIKNRGIYGYCVYFSDDGKPCFDKCEIEIVNQE